MSLYHSCSIQRRALQTATKVALSGVLFRNYETILKDDRKQYLNLHIASTIAHRDTTIIAIMLL